MKRTILFFTILVFIVLCGLLIKWKYINTRSNLSGDIEANNKWSTIMIGRWKYSYENLSDKCKWIHNGEIFFHSDNTYKLLLTMKEYDYGNYERNYLENPSIIIGGAITGKWSCESGRVIIASTTCDLKATTGIFIDNCATYNSLELGNIEGERISSEIQQFNQKKITVKGTELATGGKALFTFTRIK